MLYSLAQFLQERYNEFSVGTQKAIVFVLGQPVVDAINSGYMSTVEYLSSAGHAGMQLGNQGIELLRRLLGL